MVVTYYNKLFPRGPPYTTAFSMSLLLLVAKIKSKAAWFGFNQYLVIFPVLTFFENLEKLLCTEKCWKEEKFLNANFKLRCMFIVT